MFYIIEKFYECLLVTKLQSWFTFLWTTFAFVFKNQDENTYSMFSKYVQYKIAVNRIHIITNISLLFTIHSYSSFNLTQNNYVLWQNSKERYICSMVLSYRLLHWLLLILNAFNPRNWKISKKSKIISNVYLINKREIMQLLISKYKHHKWLKHFFLSLSYFISDLIRKLC